MSDWMRWFLIADIIRNVIKAIIDTIKEHKVEVVMGIALMGYILWIFC